MSCDARVLSLRVDRLDLAEQGVARIRQPHGAAHRRCSPGAPRDRARRGCAVIFDDGEHHMVATSTSIERIGVAR